MNIFFVLLGSVFLAIVIVKIEDQGPEVVRFLLGLGALIVVVLGIYAMIALAEVNMLQETMLQVSSVLLQLFGVLVLVLLVFLLLLNLPLVIVVIILVTIFSAI